MFRVSFFIFLFSLIFFYSNIIKIFLYEKTIIYIFSYFLYFIKYYKKCQKTKMFLFFYKIYIIIYIYFFIFSLFIKYYKKCQKNKIPKIQIKKNIKIKRISNANTVGDSCLVVKICRDMLKKIVKKLRFFYLIFKKEPIFFNKIMIKIK